VLTINPHVAQAAVPHFKMPLTLDAANAQQWIDLFRHLN
jgi:hypothetical protein